MRWRNTPPQISVGNEHIIRPTNRFGMDTISHDPDSLHGSGLHLENPAIFIGIWNTIYCPVSRLSSPHFPTILWTYLFLLVVETREHCFLIFTSRVPLHVDIVPVVEITPGFEVVFGSFKRSDEQHCYSFSFWQPPNCRVL